MEDTAKEEVIRKVEFLTVPLFITHQVKVKTFLTIQIAKTIDY